MEEKRDPILKRERKERKRKKQREGREEGWRDGKHLTSNKYV